MSQKTKVNKFLAGAVTATMVATAVVPTAALAAKPSEGFSDVGHLAPETLAELDRVVELGLMTGFGNAGLFKPETYMNRGQVAKALAKYEAGKSGMSIAQYYHALKLDGKVQPFADVPKNSSDQELYQASLIVKNAGTFKGVSNKLNPDSNITRGHMASVLVRAFDLKATGKATDFADKGDADTEEIATNMQILKDNGVAKELSDNKFNPNQNVKRIQMASFLLRAYDVENPEAPAGSGITSVKAINDTRYEITFDKAFDKDVAYLIEKEPKRFVIFDGSKNEHSVINDNNNIMNASSVTFDADKKVATITLPKVPTTDINYTIALMDNVDNAAAKVIAKSSPQVLVKGIETPSADVNTVQDKLVIDFKQKMKETAKEVDKYELRDNKGKVLGDLDEFVTGEGVWVDGTTKKAVEFKLKKTADRKDYLLEAGKEYKIYVKEELVTDDGAKLSDSKRTITFKTPSVNEARPEAKFATFSGKTIVVHFDKDLENKEANLDRLTKVKTATGDDVKITKAVADGKKLTVTVDEDLDKNTSYKVTLPENSVENAYFYNALNKAVDKKAESQEDIAVKQMKASFVKDNSEKAVADLVLAFDQNVLEELTSLEIRVDGETYELESDATIEYGKNPKELVIKNVETSFNNLQLEDGKSYEVVAKAGAVKTDSPSEPTNKEELKDTVKSTINVAAPRAKRMELVSAEEIVVEFDQSIEGTIKPNKVTVDKSYLIDRDGKVDENTNGISDVNNLKVTVNGNKVTIKTAKADVKFNTGAEQVVKFEPNAFKGKNGVENKEVKVGQTEKTQTTTDYAFVDNAAPEMIGAYVKELNKVEITYSEAFTVTAGENFASQYTFEGTEDRNYGSTTAAQGEQNSVEITFTPVEGATAFKVDKNYPDAKVKYSSKTGFEVKDTNGNKAKSQTLTGISAN